MLISTACDAYCPPPSTCLQVNAENLIAGYVGQTAERVRKFVRDAEGGVLFIDEAHRLAPGSGAGAYKDEALGVLMQVLLAGFDCAIQLICMHLCLCLCLFLSVNICRHSFLSALVALPWSQQLSLNLNVRIRRLILMSTTVGRTLYLV